jgi:hypothetical protein
VPKAKFEVIEDLTLTVPQNEYDVPVDIEAEDGDRLEISADGQIWAGVLFTGKNGPEGWTNTAVDSKFPAPNARAYGLLVKVGHDYMYVGRKRRINVRNGGGEVFMRINDDDPSSGNGEFNVRLRQLRREEEE